MLWVSVLLFVLSGFSFGCVVVSAFYARRAVLERRRVVEVRAELSQVYDYEDDWR